MKQCKNCINFHPELQADVELENGERQTFICDEYPDGIPADIWYKDKNCDLFFNIDEPPTL